MIEADATRPLGESKKVFSQRSFVSSRRDDLPSVAVMKRSGAIGDAFLSGTCLSPFFSFPIYSRDCHAKLGNFLPNS